MRFWVRNKDNAIRARGQGFFYSLPQNKNFPKKVKKNRSAFHLSALIGVRRCAADLKMRRSGMRNSALKKLRLVLPAAAVLGIFACSGREVEAPPEETALGETEGAGRLLAGLSEGDMKEDLDLEEIAEIERAGGYYPGLGLVESARREKAGDYAGAVLAAYKDLAWAYGYGGAGLTEGKEGLRRVEALFAAPGGDREKLAAAAAGGVLAFSEERWAEAGEILRNLLTEEESPDSFLRWMLLVCALEREENAAARSAYSSIRARYSLFPEYWYRGARAFAAGDGGGRGAAGNIASEYAEQCINLSPQGPFAEDCRRIIAGQLGLESGGEAIRSRAEIEDTIRRSVASGNPELLEDLFPLITLPDNAYTLYTLGALRAISSVSVFREFFSGHAAAAKGRLAERFNFILRG
jgi:hypothetical protein